MPQAYDFDTKLYQISENAQQICNKFAPKTSNIRKSKNKKENKHNTLYITLFLFLFVGFVIVRFCLYFVGFYVLLLFDIVLCIQVENLTAITVSEQTMAAYLQNSFFSAGYLMAASIVALKCLNLVPDLAAWMIPEGDTAFSTRNFGEGVAQQAKMTATGAIGTMMR